MRKGHRERVVQELTAPSDGFTNGDEAFVALSGLIALRNPVQHGRVIQNRQLGEAYLGTFERVLP